MATREQLKELETIRRANDWILRPVDVVERAADPDSPLHGCFEWDDTKAGQEYRLQQARHLIRVTVCLLPYHKGRTIKAYVSMQADRHIPGGGYRSLVDVMTNEESRAALLEQALAELGTWKRKYHDIKELEPVFEAMGKVRRQALESPDEEAA